ncbi:MAG: hypothetical protein AB7S68_28980 [Polyangiaceae bacterium]
MAPSPKTRTPRPWRTLGWLFFCGIMGLGKPVIADEQPGRVPGALFGGRIGPPPPKAPVQWDPWLPTGRPRIEAPRPALAGRSCSSRRPVCVHYLPGSDPRGVSAALDALVGAWERLVDVQELPTPLGDQALGGDPRADWYLQGDARLEVLADAPTYGMRDQASGYCQSPLPRGAERDRWAVQCLTELSALRLDASESAFTRRAVSTQVWWTIGYPTDMDASAIDDAQRNPQLALGGSELSESAEGGSALLFEFLDEKYGASRWGTLGLSLYALGASLTAGDGWLYDNEPDIFDVIRHTFDEDPVELANALADFELARARLGDRDDGRGLPEMAWVGSFGRVRFDWALRYSELPKFVAPWRAVEPTGAVFVFLELDKLPEAPELGLRANWEAPVSFKWNVAILDSSGKLRKQVAIKYEPRATQTERTLVLDAKQGEALVITGVNQGGIDLNHPFDPDVSPFEPHDYSLYLVDME